MSCVLELRKEIGTRLEQARKTAGYASADQFCQKNNLETEPYLACEAGTIGILASQALKYSEKLRVSISWLMTGTLLKDFG